MDVPWRLLMCIGTRSDCQHIIFVEKCQHVFLPDSLRLLGDAKAVLLVSPAKFVSLGRSGSTCWPERGERADFSQAIMLLEGTFQLLHFCSTVFVGIQCYVTQGNTTIHPFKHHSKSGSKRWHGWQLLTWSFLENSIISYQDVSHTTRCIQMSRRGKVARGFSPGWSQLYPFLIATYRHYLPQAAEEST